MKTTAHFLWLLISFTIGCSLVVTGCSDDDDKEDNGDQPIPTIELSSIALDHSFEATTHSLTVEANGEWNVTSSEKWCTVFPRGGMAGEAIVSVRLTENEEETDRMATLTFRSGTYQKEVKVQQDYKIKEVPFTDQNLKSYCIEHFDTDGDGIISIQESSHVTSLQVSGLGISSLDGIEHFTRLTHLDCIKMI